MKSKAKENKELNNSGGVVWIYDNEIGWIDIGLFLKRVKEIEKKIKKIDLKTVNSFIDSFIPS